MTPEQMKKIVDNAPEGATHYDDSVDYYVVKENRVIKIWTGEKWRPPLFNWDNELRSGIIKPQPWGFFIDTVL